MAETTTYLVSIGDRVFRVALRGSDAEGVSVRVDDGPERRASLHHTRGVHYTLALDETRTELLGRPVSEGVELAIAGRAFRAEVVDEARARLASLTGGRGGSHARRELRAPMPGLLVGVLARAGDQVQPLQPLAVLRAMKMENELSLPRGGTVVAVKAEAGQTVDQGQVLLVVE
jgi:biotin carboxyl carrier protein